MAKPLSSSPFFKGFAKNFLRIKEMKLRNIILGATLLCGFSAPAFAQGMMPPPPPNGGGHFEMVDANKDGFLTKEEVRAAHSKKFVEIDANKDGFLTKEEMKNHHKMQQDGRMQKRGDARLNHLDENNDGNVSRDEWVNGPERHRKLMAEKMAQRFDQLDANKDGKLSDAELSSMPMMGGGHHKMGQGKMGRHKMGDKEMGPPKGKMPDIDKNKDGKISKAEWEALPMPLFEKGDLNKDGKVSREEAQSAMRSAMQNRR
jgi:EF hand